jgi:hypothetical protein
MMIGIICAMEDMGTPPAAENQQPTTSNKLIHEIKNELIGLACGGLYYGLAGASLVMDAIDRRDMDKCCKNSDE